MLWPLILVAAGGTAAVAVALRRGTRGGLAIVTLGVACACTMPALGWNQTSRYAQIRSLAEGRASIDRYAAITGDKATRRGHFYPDKAPGLALLGVPWYLALEAAGVPGGSRGGQTSLDAIEFVPSGAERAPPEAPQLTAGFVHELYGTTWALALLLALVPAMLLLFLVRAVAGVFEPGAGLVAALALGVGTMLLPFSSLLFGHALAACLGFASFAVALRRGGEGRLVAAGALSGFAVAVEYPLALVAVGVGLYVALTTRSARLVGWYLAGAIAGVAPLLIYSWAVFGSPFHLSYGSVGLNSGGFFGVGVPHLHTLLQLLFGDRGLVTRTPIVALGVVGLVLLHRQGRRAEALTAGGIAVAFLIYNAGYYLPFGGYGPGPRFLVPALPFVLVGVALVFRRLPLTTLGLALISGLTMVAAAGTEPQLADNLSTSAWADRIAHGEFTGTVLTAAGLGRGWAAIAPFFLAVAAAVGIALREVRPSLFRGEIKMAGAAVAAWVGLAAWAPRLLASGDLAHSAAVIGLAGALIMGVIAVSPLTRFSLAGRTS